MFSNVTNTQILNQVVVNIKCQQCTVSQLCETFTTQCTKHNLEKISNLCKGTCRILSICGSFKMLQFGLCSVLFASLLKDCRDLLERLAFCFRNT